MHYLRRTKEANAKKIHSCIAKHFACVIEKRIQPHINSLRRSQSLHPKFRNRATL